MMWRRIGGAVGMALAVLALLAPRVGAQQQAGAAFGAALERYRDDRSCGGQSYRGVLALIDQSQIAYHVADPREAGGERGRSLAKGEVTAAEENALAATAAGKGCKVEATEIWRHVVRYFDGPAFQPFQQRAVAGLRALHN